MGIAAIVLGPSAAMLAISAALVIQAFLFGDGGITALGANCFNMAIAGSLVAYFTYRVIARGAPIVSQRRVLAAGIAGYVAINTSALLAAIEFGVQPLWFHDAAGAPLYAPYPLHIAIPAMMIGHLTFAGLAELIVTAGIVAYFQRSEPALLRTTAPHVSSGNGLEPTASLASFRKLWVALAIVLILTPLGIVAAGSAWGEWSARDFADASGRSRIAAASGNHEAPVHAPAGLERLSSIWSAPLSGYAPALIRSAPFGYLASAAVGTGLLMLAGLVLQRVVPERVRSLHPMGDRKRSFVERTIVSISSKLEHAFAAEKTAHANGLLQRLDARVKLAAIALLLIATVAAHRIESVAILFAIASALALFSHIALRTLALRVWLAVLLFTGSIALPAVFLTAGGWHAALLLLLRAETAATLAIALVLCTVWAHLLRALRVFRVPVTAVVILGMTYRYIFLFLQLAREMFEARQTRLVGVLAPDESRRLVAANVGVLLSRSIELTQDVHLAMRARGFRGEVYLLDERPVRAAAWLPAACAGIVATALIYWGR